MIGRLIQRFKSLAPFCQKFGSWFVSVGGMALLGCWTQYNDCADRKFAESLVKKTHAVTMQKLHVEDERLSNKGKQVDQIALDQASR
jgi:hypothetical protein